MRSDGGNLQACGGQPTSHWPHVATEHVNGRVHPGREAQLVRASTRYTKVADMILGQDTFKDQPTNAYLRGTTNRCCSLSLPLSLK